MSSEVEFQRTVTALALEALAGFGFALAGAGAIREHGLLTRPTQDIDLFTAGRIAATSGGERYSVSKAYLSHSVVHPACPMCERMSKDVLSSIALL